MLENNLFQRQQYGFTPGKSTAEQIVNLQLTLETLKKREKGFLVVFIDLKKAFDNVRYFDIFNLLKGIKAPKDII